MQRKFRGWSFSGLEGERKSKKEGKKEEKEPFLWFFILGRKGQEKKGWPLFWFRLGLERKEGFWLKLKKTKKGEKGSEIAEGFGFLEFLCTFVYFPIGSFIFLIS